MKILFFGNICNYAYWFARWSRSLGHDAHALMEEGDLFRPEAEDAELTSAAALPWAHYYRPRPEWDFGSTTDLERELRPLLEGYDSIHSFSLTSAAVLNALEFPFVHHNVGSFGVSATWLRGQTPRSAISPSRLRLTANFRRAMRRPQAILASTGMDVFDVMHSPFRSKCIPVPFPYDAEGVPEAEPADAADAGRPTTFLMPARQLWSLKGQHLVIDAVAALTPQERAGCRVLLSTWGPDVNRSRARIARLGLEETFGWIPFMPRLDLWRLMGRPKTVVIAEFHATSHGGGHGGIARDAMAVGVPVITHSQPSADLLVHRRAAPVLHAECNSREVLQRMRECLALDAVQMHEAGSALRSWLMEESQWQVVLPKYLAIHERHAVAATASADSR